MSPTATTVTVSGSTAGAKPAMVTGKPPAGFAVASVACASPGGVPGAAAEALPKQTTSRIQASPTANRSCRLSLGLHESGPEACMTAHTLGHCGHGRRLHEVD